MGCGPVHGGRTERLHLGRGPRVRRPPGDRPEKEQKKTEKTKISSQGIRHGSRRSHRWGDRSHHSTPPLRRRPCFLKIPQQGSGRVYCPHTPANSSALHVPNTEIFKGPDAEKKSELMRHHSRRVLCVCVAPRGVTSVSPVFKARVFFLLPACGICARATVLPATADIC